MSALTRSRVVTTLVLAMLVPGASLFAGPQMRAKPLPECRSFFVTTFGYDFRVTPPLITTNAIVVDSVTYQYKEQPSSRHMLTSELGIMHNLDPRYAVGFSQYLGWDVSNTLHGGFNVRGRRWLDHQKSVDVTAGTLLWGIRNHHFSYPGFVGTASMNFNDWENVKLTVMALPTTSKQTEVGAFLGYQTGGKPGLIMTSAAVLTAGILAVIFFTAYTGN